MAGRSSPALTATMPMPSVQPWSRPAPIPGSPPLSVARPLLVLVLRTSRVKKTPTGHRWVRTKSCRSEEYTSELQSRPHLVCRLLLEKKKIDDGSLNAIDALHSTERVMREELNAQAVLP